MTTMAKPRQRRLLKVEGVSMVALKSHPLPESVNDRLLHNIPNNDEKHTTKHDRHNSVLSHSTWSTRSLSSASSLDDDEFDHESSSVVQKLFDDIDAVMYKDKPHSARSSRTFDECWEWMDRYPHLRVVGEQIHPDGDVGFQTLSLANLQMQDESGDETRLGISSRLSIHGLPMDIHLPLETANVNGDAGTVMNSQVPFEIEEVFAEEGEYEELISVDYSDDQVRDACNVTSDTREPHVDLRCSTPIRENLVDLLNNRIWGEVISWMRPLLTEFVEHVHHGINLPKTHNTAPPVLPPSRATKSRLGELPNVRLSTAPARSLVSQHIDGVLTVSPKTLQRRQKLNMGLPSNSGAFPPLLATDVTPERRVALVRPRRVPASGRLAPLHRAARASIGEIKEDDWLPSKPVQRPKTSKQPTPPSTGASAYRGRPITLPPLEMIDGQQPPVLLPKQDKSHRVERRRASFVSGRIESGKQSSRRRYTISEVFPANQHFDLNDITTPDKNLPQPDTKDSEELQTVSSEATADDSWATTSGGTGWLSNGPSEMSSSPQLSATTSLWLSNGNTIDNSLNCPQKEKPQHQQMFSPRTWEMEQTPELQDVADHEDDLHTVEPFVSWLLNQVQTNACRAAENSAAIQAKNRSSS